MSYAQIEQIHRPDGRVYTRKLAKRLLRCGTAMTTGERVVVAALLAHKGKAGICPSEERLAAELGLSARQVRSHIRRAEKDGFISVTRRHRRHGARLPNSYRINMDRLPATSSPGQAVLPEWALRHGGVLSLSETAILLDILSWLAWTLYPDLTAGKGYQDDPFTVGKFARELGMDKRTLKHGLLRLRDLGLIRFSDISGTDGTVSDLDLGFSTWEEGERILLARDPDIFTGTAKTMQKVPVSSAKAAGSGEQKLPVGLSKNCP